MTRDAMSWTLTLALSLGTLGMGTLGLSACGGEEQAESSSNEATQTPSAEEAPDTEEAEPEVAEAEPEISAEEVPVEDDFADEAAEQITAENYADELAGLEQEIQAEAGEAEEDE